MNNPIRQFDPKNRRSDPLDYMMAGVCPWCGFDEQDCQCKNLQEMTNLINFNGKLVKITGTVLRMATEQEKKASNVEGNYAIVDYKYDNVEYRGIWQI
jgi:hypothetical protein